METTITTTGNQTLDVAIKTILLNWHQQTKAIVDYFAKHAETDYQAPVAPNRNKAIYLLGHLIASNDDLLPLLGFGDRLYPELDGYFTPNTEWNYDSFPSLPELQQKWAQLLDSLNQHIEKLQAQEWLERHTRVSQEDFETDPMRNKLNVLIGRTMHIRYHLGQLNLISFKDDLLN
jgi:hypothetical protein